MGQRKVSFVIRLAEILSRVTTTIFCHKINLICERKQEADNVTLLHTLSVCLLFSQTYTHTQTHTHTHPLNISFVLLLVDASTPRKSRHIKAKQRRQMDMRCTFVWFHIQLDDYFSITAPG